MVSEEKRKGTWKCSVLSVFIITKSNEVKWDQAFETKSQKNKLRWVGYLA